MDPQRYSSLYCAKLIGAFFVICIHLHCTHFKDNNFIYTFVPFIRTAVPIFLVISGYFLYKGNRTQAIDRCKKTLIKIIWITIYSYLFYFILNPPDITSLRFLCRTIIYGSVIHLWYLNAYIETLLCFIILLKINKLSLIWIIAPIFYIAGILLGTYNWLFDLPTNIDYARNALTIGLPFVWIGWQLRKHKVWVINKISHPYIWVIVFAILSIIEVWAIRPFDYPYSEEMFIGGDSYIFTIPLVVSLFVLAIKHPTFGHNTWFERLGKDYSLYIYIFHIIVIENVERYSWQLGCPIPIYLLPFIVFILTVAFIYIWRRASIVFFPTRLTGRP